MEAVPKKVCSVCKVEKLLSEYQDEGKWPYCRECNRERSKRYYHAHKAQKNEVRKKNLRQARHRKNTVDENVYEESLSLNAEPDFRVMLVKTERPNEAFKLEQSTWKIECSPDIGRKATFDINSDRKEIVKAIETLAARIAERYSPDHECMLTVFAPNEDQKSTPQLKIRALDSETIAEWTLKLMTQSGRDYSLQQLEFRLMVFSLNASGRQTNPVLDSAKSRSVIQVQTNPQETNCMARSLVVGLAVNKLLCKFKTNLTETEINDINFKKANKTQLNDGVVSDEEVHQIKVGIKYKIQGILANALHRLAGVDRKEEGNNFDDLELFAKFLGVQVVVYDIDSKKPIYPYEITKGDMKTLTLLLNRQHYDYLLHPTLAFPEKAATHSTCNICGAIGVSHLSEKTDATEWRECVQCFRWFPTKECFDSHKELRRQRHSNCETYWKCRDCGQKVERKLRKPGEHVCGESLCKNCKEWVMDPDHPCYLQNKSLKPSSKKYGWFDFEAWTETQELCECGRLIMPEPCACKRLWHPEQYLVKCLCGAPYKLPEKCACERSIVKDQGRPAECACGRGCKRGKQHMNYVAVNYWSGTEITKVEFGDLASATEDVADKFCRFLFSDKFRNYTFFAHNAKSYDAQPIQKWLESQSIAPKTVYNGQKIMQLKEQKLNIRIHDSFLHLSQPLRLLEETWDLTQHKGDFPHKFNHPSNYNYVGKYPDKKYYGYNEMILDDRNEFDKWYRTTDGKIFNFRDELRRYCKQDVEVLSEACTKYKDLMMHLFEMDPWRYLTIAQAAKALYLAMFMPEKSIAVHLEHVRQTSLEARQWLYSLDEIDNIQHAHSPQGEKYICGRRVDGYNAQTNTVYQFHGCYWHGCKKCFNSSTMNEERRESMGKLYEATLEFDAAIRSAGYNLVTFWEHNMTKQMKNISFLDEQNSPSQREALFGGRTEVFKIHFNGDTAIWKGTRSHRIKYIDVVSLYPTVMSKDKYPIGHYRTIPKSEFGENRNTYNKNWFGFIHCKVAPPRGLYTPVLPYKVRSTGSNKLMFGLCRTCMEESHFIVRKKCRHSTEERSFVWFGTTVELEKAIEKGYKVQEIYEVRHFDKSSDELFKGYMDEFVAIKLRASCKSTDSKTQVQSNIKAATGKDVSLDDIGDNPGLKAIAKMYLNSLWGKFGQRDDLENTEYFRPENTPKFIQLLRSDKYKLQGPPLIITDDLLLVAYKEKREFLRKSYRTNLYVAEFTTSWARLRLYAMLERVGDSLVYCDTDSVVYIADAETEEKIKEFIGNSLGQFQDELKGELIVIWEGTGPKDYSFVIIKWCVVENKLKPKVISKTKGLRSDRQYEDMATIDSEAMESMRDKLLKGEFLEKTQKQFKLAPNHDIVVGYVTKKWQCCFDKRIVVYRKEGYVDSVPYGYN